MALSEEFLPKIQRAFTGGVMPASLPVSSSIGLRMLNPNPQLQVAVCMNNTQPYVESGFTYPNYVEWQAGTRTVSLLAPTAVRTDILLS